jgi:hypothetical protein
MRHTRVKRQGIGSKKFYCLCEAEGRSNLKGTASSLTLLAKTATSHPEPVSA